MEIAVMPAGNRRPDADSDVSVIKCVVWDLDDTIWQGTLMEGDEVAVKPGVMEVIRELDNRGILQSIASKNDFAAALEKLTVFGLDEYFLHPQIGWTNKSDSLRIIAERLGIGLKALAFIDDQAFERDEVRFSLPEATVIDAADVDRLLYMPSLKPHFATNESRIRRQMYQADICRQQAEARFAGPRKDFLATLSMVLTVRVATEQDLRRAEELTIRTNQLNTTGRTYSCAELNALLHSSDHLLLVADLQDRYGTSGTVGLALIKVVPNSWRIKLLIMSCRVISRGIGGIMLSYILHSASKHGVGLRAEFVANDRNQMMYLTYKFHGFYELASEEEDLILLEHDLASIRPFPGYVTVREGE
jgi:FkbH-like protein